MNDNHDYNIFISRLLSRTSTIKPTHMHSNTLEPQPSSLQCPLYMLVSSILLMFTLVLQSHFFHILLDIFISQIWIAFFLPLLRLLSMLGIWRSLKHSFADIFHPLKRTSSTLFGIFTPFQFFHAYGLSFPSIDLALRRSQITMFTSWRWISFFGLPWE